MLSSPLSPGMAPLWRNRVQELRYVAPYELADHPYQWRTHPDHQRAALRGVLQEIGIAGALLAYVSPTTGQLTSIDGHLRKSLGETPWPTLILDVTDEEAALLLATTDPLAALAEASQASLSVLLRQVQSGDGAIQQMLSDLAQREGIVPRLAGNLAGEDREPPDEFPAYDETIPVEHTCPKCGYEWSGGS
jgi:hypothetical protein